MHLNALLLRDDCIRCPAPTPCNCAANQDCFQINRDCYTCSQTRCVARGSGGKNSKGVSRGAMAGAVVGVLVFLAAAVALLFWHRRRSRRRAKTQEAHNKKDIPAPAETVLNRPDPIEKLTPIQPEDNTVRLYQGSSATTIDLDPQSQRTSPHGQLSVPSQNINPFADDATSIQTAGTEGTNVIPIALVSTDVHHADVSTSDHRTSSSSFPVRPPRTPDLDLNLDHVNLSRDSVHPGVNYAQSSRSGVSGVSRNSYMSSASYSSDLLEAPMIITPTKGAVRQVLGVVKPEVISAPASVSSASRSSDGLKPPSSSRPAVGSPLANTSFGPADIVKEVDENTPTDPFADEASVKAEYGASPPHTATTFARSSTGAIRDSQSEWDPETPMLPWARGDDASRPSSMSTQAGSVIDIGSATRVNVGLSGAYTINSSQLSPNSIPRSPYRTTMGRLVSPLSPRSGTLQEQQQMPPQVPNGSMQSRRMSGTSVMSASSTRADSILEEFPFVPPSPISDRPARPPISPLAQQSFKPASPLPSPTPTQHVINVAPPSPMSEETLNLEQSKMPDSPLPAPPDRRTLGLSTGSQLSTASSGLGSFPFQIDPGSGEGDNNRASSIKGRQRASLDTLALTSDLSSYPLGFERDSILPALPKT